LNHIARARTPDVDEQASSRLGGPAGAAAIVPPDEPGGDGGDGGAPGAPFEEQAASMPTHATAASQRAK
jgi:hypothetical protein